MNLFCPYNRNWSFLLFAGISYCQSFLKAFFNFTAQVRIMGCYNFHPVQAEHYALLHRAWKLGKFGSLETVVSNVFGKRQCQVGLWGWGKEMLMASYSHNPPWNGDHLHCCLLHLHSSLHSTFLNTLMRINVTKIKTWIKPYSRFRPREFYDVLIKNWLLKIYLNCAGRTSFAADVQ